MTDDTFWFKILVYRFVMLSDNNIQLSAFTVIYLRFSTKHCMFFIVCHLTFLLHIIHAADISVHIILVICMIFPYFLWNVIPLLHYIQRALNSNPDRDQVS
jgi:hypothetical protein